MSCCCGCDDWKVRAENAERDRDYWWRKWQDCRDRDHWKDRAEKAQDELRQVRDDKSRLIDNVAAGISYVLARYGGSSEGSDE